MADTADIILLRHPGWGVFASVAMMRMRRSIAPAIWTIWRPAGRSNQTILRIPEQSGPWPWSTEATGTVPVTTSTQAAPDSAMPTRAAAFSDRTNSPPRPSFAPLPGGAAKWTWSIGLRSAVSALPAGLLAWKLIGARHKASDLVMGVASAVFSGTLVLAVLAPLVALYYNTSGFLGGTLAMATGGLALVTGLVILLRAVWMRVPKGTSRFSVAAPVAVIMGIQLATLLQFIYVASPILPEVTVFDGGADAMVAN